MRQFFSFATTTTRQNVKASVSKWRSHNEYNAIYNRQFFLPENVVTLSWQYCRVPSSALISFDNEDVNQRAMEALRKKCVLLKSDPYTQR